MNSPIAHALFSRLLRYPKITLVLSLALMVICLLWLPQLYKDTRSDAFLSPTNPALLYRDKVKQQFGLADPIVIAVVNNGAKGVFTPGNLQLINTITEIVQDLSEIDEDRVFSLATENNIVGTDEGMEVNGFLDEIPSTQQQADALLQAVLDFPLYRGNLASEKGNATLIVAELLNEESAQGAFEQINEKLNQLSLPDGTSFHIAGEGAVAGYLGSYIDADAARLNPLAALIITVLILLAFKRLLPALVANVIIAASVLMTLSLMAASDVPFFVITNAMPVILIGISVADSIHIFSQYYQLKSRQPELDQYDVVLQTLMDMWRPITLTSLTTIAGFLGLYLASYMPPFQYMGLFSALGVAVAWLYSLTFLPAVLMITNPRPSASYSRNTINTGGADFTAKFMVLLGTFTVEHPRKIITTAFIACVMGLWGASHITVDEDRIETFDSQEKIYIADYYINHFLNGSNNIDIVIETNEVDALYNVEHLQRIEKLQEFALTLPHVQASNSIVDYLKQINRSLNGGSQDQYKLPDSSDLVAQYFLIYASSADPTDFEEEVDYDYQHANLRLTLNSSAFSETRQVVEALQEYLSTQFNRSDIKGSLSGRVTLNYYWVKDLGKSHFSGVAIALTLVGLVSALLFGSLYAGLLALVPVVASILFIYCIMVLLNIPLGIGTSMFATVAIGLGVDFSIHSIDKLRNDLREDSTEIKHSIAKLYPLTGRALLLNFIIIATGFGVLISSQVVPLHNFGLIVACSVFMSFIASVTLVPAIVMVFKPRFMLAAEKPRSNRVKQSITGAALVFIAVLITSPDTQALTAQEVVTEVNAIDDGQAVSRKLTMTLTDKRGKSRVRDTFGYRKYFGEDKRSIIFYQRPTNIKGTGFLTYDYRDNQRDDDQWLYLPAMRKVRRISSSDRGDYFLGTDFTFEEIKNEGKISTDDYNFTLLADEVIDGIDCYHLRSETKTAIIAKELGYISTESWIDKRNFITIKSSFIDRKGRPLKTLTVAEIRKVQGIWTRHRLHMINHKTGHQSLFEFSEVDYQSAVDDSLFTQQRLRRGR